MADNTSDPNARQPTSATTGTSGTAGSYDDDGALAQQTPGLDPEPIRREAGPDWPAGTEGELEADTAPAGGSGAEPSEPRPSSQG